MLLRKTRPENVEASQAGAEPSKTRIILVDDHALVRRGIRAVLGAEPDLEVVAEASGGMEAVGLVRELRPDIVLMDFQMPGLDGLETTRLVKQAHPTTAVIIVTVNDSEALLIEAIRAGASGYVLKDYSCDLLVQSIRAVTQGGSIIPSELLRSAMRGGASVTRKQPLAEPLSPRESEVIQLIVDGLDYQEIAERLCVARVTVKKHAQGIFAKLGASDRTQAAVKAVRLGLVNVES